MTAEPGPYVVVPTRHLQRLAWSVGRRDTSFSSRLTGQSFRCAVEATCDFLRIRLRDLLACPIAVEDDGILRRIRFMDAIEYSFDRHQREVSCARVLPDGSWASDALVSVDTFLSRPMWRAVVIGGLRSTTRDWLGAARHACPNSEAFDTICNIVADCACRRAVVGRALRAKLPVKQTRRQLRDAFAFDKQVLALARAALLNARRASLTQRWLTFVWKNVEALERIRVQTPTLLAPVAELMFDPNLDYAGDPTRAFRKWLHGEGVAPAAHKLLVQKGSRAFRFTIRHWEPHLALEALALALKHASRPNGASALPNDMALATYDAYEWMTPSQLGRSLRLLSPQFFCVAQRAADKRATAFSRRTFLHDEYGLVLKWWLDVGKSGARLPASRWERWIELAREHLSRERERAARTTWSSAIESWQVDDVRINALISSLALFDEGASMHHCVHEYVRDCLAGSTRLFSARATIDGIEHRATIGLKKRTNLWRVWQVQGPCNRTLHGPWLRIANELADEYSRRDTSAALPETEPRRHFVCGMALMGGFLDMGDIASQAVRRPRVPILPPPPAANGDPT